MGLRYLSGIECRYPGATVFVSDPIAKVVLSDYAKLNIIVFEASNNDLKTLNKTACVIISTPTCVRFNIFKQFVELGFRNFFLEKLACSSRQEYTEMLSLQIQYKLRIAINHFYPITSNYQELTRVLNNCGELISITLDASNMGLLMNGSHYIHIANTLFSEDLKIVFANVTRTASSRGAQFYDIAGSLELRTHHSKRLTIFAEPNIGHGVVMVFSGRTGKVILNQLGETLLTDWRKPEFLNSPMTRYGEPSVRDITNFKDCDLVNETAKHLASFIDGKTYIDIKEIKNTMNIMFDLIDIVKASEKGAPTGNNVFIA